MKRITTTIFILNLCGLSYSASWDGSGTKDDPFLISTPQQLVELAEEVNNGTGFQNEYFNLTNDIDLSEVCGDSLGNWIGIGSILNYFEGSFLGGNHSISNLYIEHDDDTDYCGLFGYIGEQGSVVDLTIQNGSIYNSKWNGAIAAINNGLISNCKNINCSVKSWQYSGGICGVNYNTIENCENQSEVACSFCCGGICSYNYGSIINCSNKNGITARNGGGGICGYNGGFDYSNCQGTKIGFIDNCNNEGFIIGETKIGGITGRNDGLITNVNNSGEVFGFEQVGGITGFNGGFDGVTGLIANSYNIGEITGTDSLTGGIVGYGNNNSEIYNVCTSNDVRCVNTPVIDYIGVRDGLNENCYSLNIHMVDGIANLDSIVSSLNDWIIAQSDTNTYNTWEVKNNYIGHTLLYPDSTRNDTIGDNQDDMTALFNINSQDDIRIFTGESKLYLISPADQTLYIYTTEGKMVHKADLVANIMTLIPINKGVYVVGGKKVVVH